MTKKILMAMVVVLIAFNIAVYGYMFANETGSAWSPPPSNTGTISSIPIDQLIVCGGSAFLLSFSEYQKYLHFFEKNDTEQSASIIQDTYNQIAIAYMNFTQAYQQTVGIKCDPEIIEALSNFDYETYKLDNALIEEIFNTVKGYLKDCKINSWYLYIALRMGKIMDELNIIKTTIEQGKTPNLSLMWRLNQEFMRVSLEGQYCAEIFINATKKL